MKRQVDPNPREYSLNQIRRRRIFLIGLLGFATPFIAFSNLSNREVPPVSNGEKKKKKRARRRSKKRTTPPAVEISKGENSQGIEILLLGDFEGITSFSIQRKGEDSVGPWIKIEDNFGRKILDRDVELYKIYEYRISFLDKKGKLRILEDYGYRGKYDREKGGQTFPKIDVSKGDYHDCIKIRLHSKFSDDFEEVNDFQIYRKKKGSLKPSIKLNKPFLNLIIDDDPEIIPGKEHPYIYRVIYYDKYGRKIQLIDCGFKAGARP